MKKIVVFLSLLIVFQLKVSGVVYASDSLSEEARLAAIAASEAAARAAQANNEVDDARLVLNAALEVAEAEREVAADTQTVALDAVGVAAAAELVAERAVEAARLASEEVELNALELAEAQAQLVIAEEELALAQEIKVRAEAELEEAEANLTEAKDLLADAELLILDSQFIRYRGLSVPVGVNLDQAEAREDELDSLQRDLDLATQEVELEQVEFTAAELAIVGPNELVDSRQISVQEAEIAQLEFIAEGLVLTEAAAEAEAVKLNSVANVARVEAEAAEEIAFQSEKLAMSAQVDVREAEVSAARLNAAANTAQELAQRLAAQAEAAARTVAISFDDLSNRSDTSVSFVGRLTANRQPADTWFILREDNGANLSNSDCNSERRNQRRLTVQGQLNQYVARSLRANTAYQVGFCGENDVNLVRLGGSVSFVTKRSESTVVEHSCRDNTLFSSEDGPLNIIVNAEGINTDRDADTAFIRVNNRGNTGVDITTRRASFAGGFIRQEGQAPRRRNSIYSVTVARTNSDYTVELSEGSDWTASFSCSIAHCVQSPIGRPNVCGNVQNQELVTIFE